MLIDPLAAARAGIREAEYAHRRHVVPLYEPGEREEARLAGSGVLIAIPGLASADPTVLIVTAAHVADFSDDSTLFVPGSDGGPVGPRPFVTLADVTVGEGTRTALPASGTRDPDDPLDIAFAEIDISQLGPSYAPVWAIQAEPDEAADPFSLYVMHGYPRTKNGKYRPGQHIQPVIHAHTAKAAPAERLPDRFDPAFHIALHYDRKNDYDLSTGGQRVAPDLDKMSGGPIWGIPGDATLLGQESRLSLVGICTEQPRGTEVVMGTRMNVVLEAIKYRHPDLAHGLPRTATTRVNVQVSSNEMGENG